MVNWKTVKLGDIFQQYRNELWIKDAESYGQITISKRGSISFRGSKTGKSIGRKRQFMLDLKTHPNTLLFTRQGVADGAIAFAPAEVDRCIATENMPMFSLNESMATKSFIQHLLLSAQFKSELAKIVPVGTAQKSIHERDLMKIPIELPSLTQQKMIEALLDSQSNNCNLLTAEITEQEALLKKLRQSILQDAIQGKLTADWRKKHPVGPVPSPGAPEAPPAGSGDPAYIEPASVLLERIQAEKQKLIAAKKIRKQKPLPPINPNEIPFDLPEGWEWTRLDDLIDVGSGVAKGKKYKKKTTNIDYLRVANVQRSYLDLQVIKKITVSEEDADRYLLQKNDLLVTEGGDPDKVGRCAIWNNEIKPCIHQNHIFRLRDFARSKDGMSKRFLMGMINSVSSQEYFLRGYKQTTNLASINKTVLRSTPICVPPLAEQKAIVEKVGELFGWCDELERQIAKSKQNADALMASVLTDAFAPS